jgi:hypothetical protein
MTHFMLVDTGHEISSISWKNVFLEPGKNMLLAPVSLGLLFLL